MNAQSPEGGDQGTISVAEFVGAALARLGLRRCFGLVGSGNFEVTNAIIAAGVPYVASRHEGGAVTMADAYARVSGEVGLVSLHQGCGYTNAATGIGEAAKSRTPLLVLAAEAARSAVNSNFAMDQSGLARSVGALAERVYSAGTALEDVVRAFRAARDQRRTVVLNLPLDIQADRVDARLLERIPDPGALSPRPAGDAAIQRLADAIERSERPVIVAGRGSRDAGPELRALAEQSGALLATSAVVKGLFRGDRFDLGISGGFSSPTTASLLQGADLILGFGCALNMWTMRHGGLIGEGALVAQIDHEAEAIGRNRPVDIGVLGDTAATAEAVTRELAARGSAAERYRSDEVAERIAASARWADIPYESISTPERIDPRDLTLRLGELLPAERVLSIDSGNFMGYPSALLDVPDEQGFCFTQAFQAIGLGLATSIGAAFAQQNRLPVLGTGDGGFLMAIAEFETAVRERIPLLVIVYNDAAYGAEVHHFGEGGAELGTVTFPDTDIAALARGFGAEGITVRTVQDLDAVREWLDSDPDRPLVIDAKIASDGGAWWLKEAFVGHT